MLFKLLLIFLLFTFGHGELFKKFRMMDHHRNNVVGGNSVDTGHDSSSSVATTTTKQNEDGTTTDETTTTTVAMTCDVLLAKSLVTANEEKAVLQKERDALLYNSNEMTYRLQQLQQELDETTSDLTTRLFQAHQDMMTLRKETDDQFMTLTEQWQRQLDDAQNDMSVLRHQSERAIYETQQDAIRRLQQQRERYELVLVEKEEQIVVTQHHYEELAEAIRVEASQNITSIQTKANAMRTQLERNHSQQIQLLQEEARLTQERHSREIQRLQEDVTERFQHQHTVHQQTLDALRVNLTTQLSTCKNEMDKLGHQLHNLDIQHQTLQTKYKKASEELLQWEALYGSRSYCNVTYIQEDVLAIVVATRRTVQAHAMETAHRTVVVIRRWMDTLRGQVEPTMRDMSAAVQQYAQPHVDKVRAYYEQYVGRHVDKHFLPVYDQYVRPCMTKVGFVLQEGWRDCSLVTQRFHSKVVRSFQKTCPMTVSKLETMGRMPNFILITAEQSCQDAETTVNMFLWTTVTIVIFVLRSTLWTTAVWLTLLPIRILWFLSPLRLFIRKKKKKKKPAAVVVAKEEEDVSDDAYEEELEETNGVQEEEDESANGR